MAAHRYWRLRFTRALNGSIASDYIWLQEVSFRSVADVDLSVGGTASASSVRDGASPAAGAFDKSLSGNGWCSARGQFPCWLMYDHVTPVDVSTVIVRPYQIQNASYMPLDRFVFVEYSDDAVSWTSMNTFANGYVAGVDSRLGIGESSSLNKKFVSPSLPYRAYGTQLQQSPRLATMVRGGVWRWETVTTGSGTISGTVTIENIPGSRRVRLYRKHDGMLIRETWSAPNGAYSFPRIDPNWEYFVVAHDHLRVYNGVIQDMLTP